MRALFPIPALNRRNPPVPLVEPAKQKQYKTNPSKPKTRHSQAQRGAPRHTKRTQEVLSLQYARVLSSWHPQTASPPMPRPSAPGLWPRAKRPCYH